MLFNSLIYAFFLPIVLVLYWSIPGRYRLARNIVLLVASYIFYGWWDARFLLLLSFSTALDFVSGLLIHRSENRTTQKTWLYLSVAINLGFLALFKYYNFFIDSFTALLHSVGLQGNFPILSLVLPVGISFYTFHGLSYVFDIYNKKIEPTKDIVSYALFVSFFPLLVAGPIERATNLLPQLQVSRTFSYAVATDGLRQILIGLFKKMVVADNCSLIANEVFGHSDQYGSAGLFIGAVFFAFQIYGDFSGYSDIAIGSGKLFGYQLKTNFKYPYFSRDIAEFWRRWHISLSSWFKDYLYIPLGGSKGSKWMNIRNVSIVFLVSGFWHGANWTFIAWGAINALYFIPMMLVEKNRQNLDIVAQNTLFPTVKEVVQILATFVLTTLAWVFFRSENIQQALTIIHDIVVFKNGAMPSIGITWIWILLLMSFEWAVRHKEHPGAFDDWPVYTRWGVYIALTFLIVLFSYQGEDLSFIYFQF